MSFGIIIRNSESKRFKPHMNQAMGKYIHTKDEYLKTMKDMNLVPYEKQKEKLEPSLEKTQWAQDMGKRIQSGNLGSSFYKELEKKGYGPEKIKKMNTSLKKEATKINTKNGGFK